MAVWLVTGATGFVGRQVLKALLDGVAPIRDSRRTSESLDADVPQAGRKAAFAAVDLEDATQTRIAVERIAPDVVIHTAGRTPPASDEELYRINFWATQHLLSALRSLRKRVRIVLSGSAAELGPVDEDRLPVSGVLRVRSLERLRAQQVAGHEKRVVGALAAGSGGCAIIQPDRSGNSGQSGTGTFRQPARRSRA